MTTSKILLLIGAACSLAGFALLFRFGMPARVATGGREALEAEAINEIEARMDGTYRWCGGVGLSMNVVGALLQLAGTAFS